MARSKWALTRSSSNDGGTYGGKFRLYIMNADGSEQLLVAVAEARDPDWSA